MPHPTMPRDRRRVLAAGAVLAVLAVVVGAAVAQRRAAALPSAGPLTSADIPVVDDHTQLVVQLSAPDPLPADPGAGEGTPATVAPAPTTATTALPAGHIEVPVTLVDGRLTPDTMRRLSALGTVTGLRMRPDGSVVAVVDTRTAPPPPQPGATAAETVATTPVAAHRSPVQARIEAVPGTVSVVRINERAYAVTTDADADAYRHVEGVASVSIDAVAFATTSDTYWDQQWSLSNTGATIDGRTGVAGADIGVLDAWPLSTGEGQVVAVIDTGIDVGHTDLGAAMWRNPTETSCTNGVDDDHNGHVDDCAGWDFANDDSTVYDTGTIFDSASGQWITVTNDHGTHVAGIVGAAPDNGAGIAGIAPGAKIMPLKVGNANWFLFSRIAAAMYYAVDNGATIISASIGSSPGVYSLPQMQVLSDAAAYARAHGVLLVFAAGNDAVDIDTRPVFPASLPHDNVLSVGASDSRDGRAWFSNWGAGSVDLFAPGTAIVSTLPRSSPDGLYGFKYGTSMATPEVAAAAALWWSAHPGAAYTEVKAALMSSDGAGGGFAGTCVSGHRVDIGALLNPAGDGVSIAIGGLAGGRAEGPVHALVQPSVATTVAADHASLSYRATLLSSRAERAWGVVDHPVTTDYGPTTTDDQAAVNLGTYSPGARPALAYTTTLAPGTYALVAEAYDTETGATVGRPWAAYFTVQAAGSPAPPDPVEPPATTPTTTSPATTRAPATTAPPTTSSPPTTAPAPSGPAPTTTAPTTAPPVPAPTTTAAPPPTTTTTTVAPASPPTTARPVVPTTKAAPTATTTTTWRSPTTQAATPTTAAPDAPTTTAAPTSKATTTAPATTAPTTRPAAPTVPTLPPSPPSTASGSLVVSSVSPAYGSTNGGDLITVTGDGFAGDVYVLVGDVAARSVWVVSPRELRVVTPPHVAGTVGVRVALAGGPSVTLAGAFTYRVPDPSGEVPVPGSPSTTTTTRPPLPGPTTTTAAPSPTTAAPTTIPTPTAAPTTAAPAPTTGPTTTTVPLWGGDPTVTRFTFGESTLDESGQHLRAVVSGPAGLAPPGSWGTGDRPCLSAACPTFRV